VPGSNPVGVSLPSPGQHLPGLLYLRRDRFYTQAGVFAVQRYARGEAVTGQGNRQARQPMSWKNWPRRWRLLARR
jgi:hypothetical protein